MTGGEIEKLLEEALTPVAWAELYYELRGYRGDCHIQPMARLKNDNLSERAARQQISVMTDIVFDAETPCPDTEVTRYVGDWICIPSRETITYHSISCTCRLCLSLDKHLSVW